MSGVANSASTNGGTVLTIPANSVWRGSVSISAALTVAIGGGAVAAQPSVTVSGSGGSWANGDVVVAVSVAAPAVGALALLGLLATNSLATGDILVQARANPLTLVLNFSGAGVSAVAVAIGQFL